jgi:hypothetical protein
MNDYKIANRFQFEKLIERSATTEIYPEVKLIINILGQAWEDAAIEKSEAFEDAYNFFVDGRAEDWSCMIGIDSEFLSEVFNKHHPCSGRNETI